jgi:hypothetical protein
LVLDGGSLCGPVVRDEEFSMEAALSKTTADPSLRMTAEWVGEIRIS